jgi:hypothetical protein
MMAGAAEEGDVDVDIVRVTLLVVGLKLTRWREREERRRAGRIDFEEGRELVRFCTLG